MSPRKQSLEQLLKFLQIKYHLVDSDTEVQTTCFYCGKIDHLYYNIESRVWICHHCGEAGGHNRLEQAILQWVVEMSEGGFGEPEFFLDRGLDKSTVRKARLGYYEPMERYTIPYLEGEGDAQRINNISFRASREDQSPRYMRLPGMVSSPYIVSGVVNSDSQLVVLTEGELDALAVWQALGGDDITAIGLPGANISADRIIRAVPRGARIIAVFDNDAAGRKAGAKFKASVPGVRLVIPTGVKDIGELLEKQGATAVRNLLEDEGSSEESGEGETGEGVGDVESLGRAGTVRGVPSPAYIALPDNQTDWIVEDLWMDQALGFMGGLPKAMKSLLSLHLGYHIAEGKPFCTKRVLKPGPVLLVQEEDTDHLIKRRLKTINGGLGSPNLWLYTPGVTGTHFRLDSDEAMEMLDDTIRQIKPVLTILDPLANMHGLEDENQAGPMNRLMERLRHLRDLRQTSFMIVHHLRKEGIGDTRSPGQKLRGSGVLHAKAECGLYIDRTGDVLRIEVENKMNPNRVLEVKFVGNQFVYEDEVGEGVE